MRRIPWQRLSTRVVIAQVVILVRTVMVGFAVVEWQLKGQMDRLVTLVEHGVGVAEASRDAGPPTGVRISHSGPLG